MSQTNLGPLTTTFVAPTTCVSSFAHIYVSVDGGVYAGPFSTGACLPSSYDNPRSNFYSPGICPSGFTPACSWTTALGSATETAVTCCPYFESSTFTCNTATNFGWEKTAVCNSAFSTLSTAVTVVSSGNYLAGQATLLTQAAGAVNAFGVQIRYQSTDFRNVSNSTNDPNIGGDNGLSSGAKAGIGIGVSLAVLLLIGICICLYRQSRRSLPKGPRFPEFSYTSGTA